MMYYNLFSLFIICVCSHDLAVFDLVHDLYDQEKSLEILPSYKVSLKEKYRMSLYFRYMEHVFCIVIEVFEINYVSREQI